MSIVLKFCLPVGAFNGIMEWLLLRVDIQVTPVLQGTLQGNNCVVSYSETKQRDHV